MIIYSSKPIKSMEYFSLRKFQKDCLRSCYKICKVMRLTIFLLLVTLQLNAKTKAQSITLSGSGITLKSALTEIKHQSKYAFFWIDQYINSSPRVNVHFKNYTLGEALDAVLNGLPLTYRIENRLVYIVPKEKEKQRPEGAACRVAMNGKVTDST